MDKVVTLIGFIAAFCTTGAMVPQLYKAWSTGETDVLSLRMLLVLASGLLFWVAYGLLKADIVVLIANGVSLLLIAGLLYLKIRGS
jgi:MtN3 and saliva related transmembrane protein